MILEHFVKQRRFFKVTNKVDVDMFRNFLETHAWGGKGCPFILEFPYVTIPDMIRDKLIHKILKVKRYESCN
jgi:hypothetical protein